MRDDKGNRPAISPDGTALYFVVERPAISGGSDYEIRVASPENGPSRVLAQIPARRIPLWQLVHPVISPDGKWLAMPLTDGFATNVWALPTGGGPLRQRPTSASAPPISPGASPGRTTASRYTPHLARVTPTSCCCAGCDRSLSQYSGVTASSRSRGTDESGSDTGPDWPEPYETRPHRAHHNRARPRPGHTEKEPGRRLRPHKQGSSRFNSFRIYWQRKFFASSVLPLPV